MSNYKMMQNLIARLAGQHNTIGVPRVFCQMMDSLEGGVFLSQVIYWSDKGKGAAGWFYKSDGEWQEETTLSRYKVRKYSAILEDRGVLETKLKKANGAPTTHYKFDYEEFIKWIMKFLQMDYEETYKSITETTTETTTDINTYGDSKDESHASLENICDNSSGVKQIQNKVRGELEIYFSELTGLPRPKTNTATQRRSAGSLWWNPLREIAELCDWNTDRSTKLIGETVKHLKSNKMTIASPKSILNSARANVANSGVKYNADGRMVFKIGSRG